MESNFFKKFKAIASTAHTTSPIFKICFKKTDFSEIPVNLDMGI